MNVIEELFGGENDVEDRDDDVVDGEIDLDAEDWFGSIEAEGARPKPPPFPRPTA